MADPGDVSAPAADGPSDTVASADAVGATAIDPSTGIDCKPAPGSATGASAGATGLGRRRLDVVLELALWSVVAVVGTVMVTQAFGWSRGGFVAAVQSVTPLLALVVIPVVGCAIASRWWPLAAVGAAVLFGAVVLAVPLVLPGGRPAAQPDAPEIRVTVVNLQYSNARITEAADAIERTSPDIVVFTEYTAEHQAALLARPLAAELPYRAGRDGFFAGGTAVWSRYPLTELASPDMTNYDVDVVVETPGDSFRLWAVHPPYPFNDGWATDLATVADRAPTIDAPLLVAGDFNASYWHSGFRDVLDSGLKSAHISHRRGWSTSWPTDRWFPAFVRIDHALTNDRLAAVGIADFDLPGSDHRGFVVTVAAAE